MRTIVCQVCGTEFRTDARNVKFCPECRGERYLEIARQNAKERYWKLKKEQAKVVPTRERNYRPTICFECRNAVPTEETGCEWSRSFEPVDGWDARYNERLRSYNVRRCPEFRRG